jgi:Protein of unknown function (DUF1579)
MKKITITLSALCFLISTQVCFSQTKKTAPAKPKKVVVAAPAKEMNQDEMMKAWTNYMTPTEVHKMIAQSDGEWTGEVMHWMTPDAPATSSKCKCTNRMTMGGRYQISEYSGEFMGMPFEGMNILGFDNAKKVFMTTWIDNMGTGVMNMQGPWNEKTRSMSLKGTMVDPMTGKDTEAKETFTIVDDNTQVMQMFAPRPDGKGMFKTMEIKFKRG